MITSKIFCKYIKQFSQIDYLLILDMLIIYHILALLISTTVSLDNGLGLTPPMGWNSWNHYACNINQSVITKTADLLISSGLASKGYKYVNIDDCWQIDRDPQTNQIIADKKKFPSGMQYLADYMHTRNLLFGLYSDAGAKTCQGRPGSYGYETIDAQTYAKWKVDFLKYDNCYRQGIPVKVRYPIMKNALNATKRPIYYSMCEYGWGQPWLWAQNVSNSWRTTLDIKDDWLSILHNLQRQVGLESYAGPGAWNDPDMLQVGNGRLSNDQYQSHFALWALLKSPLLIGCSLEKMSNQTLSILGNQQVIGVNQDPLGKQGYRYSQQRFGQGFKEVWFGILSGNRNVFILFNRSQQQANFSVNLKNFGQNKQIKKLREIITHTDESIPSDYILKVEKVKKHASKMYIIEWKQQKQLSSQY